MRTSIARVRTILEGADERHMLKLFFNMIALIWASKIAIDHDFQHARKLIDLVRNFSQQQQTSHERIDLGAVNFTSKASDMNFTALAIKYQTILDIANKTLPACVNVTSLGDDEDDNEWRKQRDIAYQLTMDGNEHFMRFEFADALKKYDLALDNLIVVNKTATWRSTLLLSQALSLDMLDKSEEAVKKANEALKLEPNRTDIQSFIGTFYL